MLARHYRPAMPILCEGDEAFRYGLLDDLMDFNR